MSATEQPLFWKRAEVANAAALIDAENYFRAFYHSAITARRYILIAGWQFELETELLRGKEAANAQYPVSFWSLLSALCEREPELHVYVLGWDYSLAYVLERQWLQAARAKLTGHPRVHLEFRIHPDLVGSFHEKFVVVDDKIAFAGGIDFCQSRWDTCAHRLIEPDRRDALGRLSKPYHDVQAAVMGPVVRDFVEAFKAAWFAGAGKRLDLPVIGAEPVPALDQLLGAQPLRLPPEGLVLCRTLPPTESSEGVCEVQASYGALIRGAVRLIYAEAQYFTSSAIADALLQRLADAGRPRLVVIIMMPNGAESPKEDLVLGGRQRRILSLLHAAARRYGHELRVSYVAEKGAEGRPVMTFVHSKLMIVDDCRLSLGSANFTNRSMSVDSELNLVWNIDGPLEPVPEIRQLRCSLMAEHAGSGDTRAFEDIGTVLSVFDAESAKPDAKLHPLPVPAAEDCQDDELRIAIFDPSTELWSEESHEPWNSALDEPVPGRLGRWLRTAKRTLSTHAIGWRFLLALLLLYAIASAVGKLFAGPLQDAGRALASFLGLPGFALGTFLADGMHFPVPPQFYMMLTVALDRPVGWSLLSIILGSLLGGAVGFAIARQISHWPWLERRFARMRMAHTLRLMQHHPYRSVVIASLTPVAYSWLCYLAGFYRFSPRAFLLLSLLRVPKLLLYFAIVRAAWRGFS